MINHIIFIIQQVHPNWCMARKRRIGVWNVTVIKYIKLDLGVQDLLSEIETKYLRVISYFCYK
jgi:hypothetical protein